MVADSGLRSDGIRRGNMIPSDILINNLDKFSKESIYIYTHADSALAWNIPKYIIE